MKLSDICELPRLDIFKPDKDITILDSQGFGMYQAPLIGIEVEVENYERHPLQYGWSRHNDGSLRNNGAEFISKPTEPKHVETIVNHLFTTLPKTTHFSPRTSIHVHMNCRNLELMQIYNIVILHQCFEDLLYKFAGAERKKSIFCVPIGNSNYYNYLRDNFSRGHLTGWSKYTSLNLAPLHQYGTIEFRHLRGTRDVNTLYTWLHILYRLYNYAINIPTADLETKIRETSVNGNFISFGWEVLGHHFISLSQNSMLTKCMKEDMAISKLFMLDKSVTEGVL